ncbi:Hint domain-containing protein [Mariniluteicoccus flavus]
MADGTRKPIKDVKLGDWVMSTDPITGERGPRKVIDLIQHGGLHTMVAVQLADGSTIDATDRHPFWVESRGEWVDAIDLQPGDVVVMADDDRLAVESVGISERNLTAYNLTVQGLHTYFVGAGDVLVHNAVCPTGLRGASDGLTSVFGGGSVRGRSIADIRSGLLDNGFKQGLADNKSGYRFVNGTGEEVRIMSRGGQWDVRVRNAGGNWLDEFGNVPTGRAGSHDIFVYSR